MSIEIKTITLEQLNVGGKTVNIECGQIVNEYDLSPEELKATQQYIERTKKLHIKSSIVKG